ncbi:MAG: CHAT domain-containing tetratricopeptide repeat protein [Cyclobacteriaceae bacterium]
MRVLIQIFILHSIIVLFTVRSYGQDCITQLDSIDYYIPSNLYKAEIKADSLFSAMQLGKCAEDSSVIEIYNNLGLSYWDLGKLQKASMSLEAALSFLDVKDSLSSATIPIYLNLYSINEQNGNYSSAEGFLQSANKAVNHNYGFNSKENLELLYRSGIFYLNRGEYDKGLNFFLDAASITETEELRNDSLYAQILIEIGTAHKLKGDYGLSRRYLTQALRIVGGNEILKLQAVDRLSALRLEQGEFVVSESDLLNNLKTRKERYDNDTLSMLETLNNLGVLYLKLNDLVTSERYFTEAVSLSGNQDVLKASSINNIGAIYWRKGKLEQARAMFEESSNLFRDIYGPIHPEYATALNNLAAVENEQGNLDKAFDLYMKVLDLDRALIGTDHPQYATTLNNLAMIYLELGQYDHAGRLIRETLNIREKVLGKRHPAYSKALNDLGIYHLLKGETEYAIKAFDEALGFQIKHLNEVFPVLTNVQRERFFEQVKGDIERFAALAMIEIESQPQWAENAFNYYINTKSILFYASDKMRKAVQLSDDLELQMQYQQWRDLKYKLAQAYLLSLEELKTRGLSIEKLENEASDLEKSLAQSIQAFSQSLDDFHTWEDIRASLKDSSALVEIMHYRKFSVSNDSTGLNQGFEDKANYVAFIIRSDSEIMNVARWSDEADLERFYTFYRNSIQFNIEDTSSFNVFWKPLTPHLNNTKKILFASDGIFHKINPSLLKDHQTGTYVGDDYRIINITSSRDVLEITERELEKSAVIIGNPDYGSLNIGSSLEQLPEAEREAAEITALLGETDWQIETRYFVEATEQVLKETKNPGILHIATHGYFDQSMDVGNVLFSSGLYLAKSQADENDGILSAYEAMNLTLDETNLVVLSACETGLGEIKNGEGVFGLQRAFLVAGADNLIISLVKVEDKATREFMGLFYNQIILGNSIEDAFYQARDDFRKLGASPYNWGAFILLSG